MSGQLEWWLMFCAGCVAAYWTLKWFGILPVLVALCFVCYTPVTYAATGFGYLIMHNDCSDTVDWAISGDGTTGGIYSGTFTATAGEFSGDIIDYPGGTIAPGTSQTVLLDSTAEYPNGTPSVSGKLLLNGFDDFLGTGPRTSDNVFIDATQPTNNLHWYIGTDGAFRWTPHQDNSSGGSLVDTNAPWVPGDTNNLFALSISNYNLGLSYDVTGTNPLVMNLRDYSAHTNIYFDSIYWGHVMSQEGTNEWNSEFTTWSNLMSVGAGSATAWNPWLFTYGDPSFSNSVVNLDPHQWTYWTTATTWVKNLFTFMEIFGFILVLKEWMEEATEKAYFIPPEKSMSSVGGFIQGLITSATFGAMILVIPVAIDALMPHLLGLQPTGRVIDYFSEDGSQWGLWVRYGWNLLNEFFPAESLITASLYLYTVKYTVITPVIRLQYMIIRLTTCIVFFFIVGNCYGGVTITLSNRTSVAVLPCYAYSSAGYYPAGTAAEGGGFGWYDWSYGSGGLLSGGPYVAANSSQTFTLGSITPNESYTTIDMSSNGVASYALGKPRNTFTTDSSGNGVFVWVFDNIGSATTVTNTVYVGGRRKGLVHCSMTVINGGTHPAIVQNPSGTMTMSSPEMDWPTQDGTTNSIQTDAFGYSFISAAGHDYIITIGTNGLPIMQDVPGRMAVDGVQAFIEGYGMIVPMMILGMVRRFRQWGKSGATQITLE